MLLIVIEGPVGAGKTTLVNRLRALATVEIYDELVYTNADLNGTTYNPLELLYRDSLTREDYLCCQLHLQQALAKHYKLKNEHRSHRKMRKDKTLKKVVVLDRWLSSCEIFIKIRHELGLLSDFGKDFLLEDAERKQEKFMMQLTEHVDVCRFYLDTPPEECLKNIKKRNRPEEVQQSDEFWLNFNEIFRRQALKSERYAYIGDAETIERFILDVTEINLPM